MIFAFCEEKSREKMPEESKEDEDPLLWTQEGLQEKKGVSVKSVYNSATWRSNFMCQFSMIWF